MANNKVHHNTIIADGNILRISGIVSESIVDGPGYRFTIFTQGCPHKCPGCHNPQTHSPEDGSVVHIDKLLHKITENPLLKGVTFSGGEPFLQALPLAKLARGIHAAGLDIICYSGYTYEQLTDGANYENGWWGLLGEIDYLIDGPFVIAEKSLLLKFRGSKNQRILDMKKTREAGHAVSAGFADR